MIVVSKSFATAETMLNARSMRQWLWDAMGTGPEVAAKHMAACASASAAPLVQAFGIPHARLFEFWDWVGGRYSVCASPGALPISLKFGFGVFEKFLAGARAMDRHFLEAPFDRNLPVLMGLLGVWNMSFLVRAMWDACVKMVWLGVWLVGSFVRSFVGGWWFGWPSRISIHTPLLQRPYHTKTNTTHTLSTHLLPPHTHKPNHSQTTQKTNTYTTLLLLTHLPPHTHTNQPTNFNNRGTSAGPSFPTPRRS